MDDVHAGVVAIHPAKAQIDDDLLGRLAGVLQQDAGLFQLLSEDVSVVRIARKGARPDHQAAPVSDSNARLDAEFIRLAGLSLADALDFRGMQGVELVLVLGLLGAERLGAFEQRVQARGRAGRFRARCRQLAPDFPQDDTQDRALPFDGTLEALERLGMSVAAGLAPQGLAFPGKGLLGGDADELGGLDDFAPGNFQQPAVHRRGDGLLLHGGVDDDPLEFRRTHRLRLHGGVDGGLQEFFDAGFADGGPEASDLSGIAGQPRLVVLLAAEILPDNSLGPAGHHVLVAEVKGVLEVEERGHEPDRQARTPRRTHPGSGDFQGWVEQVAAGHPLAWPILAGEGRRQGRFDSLPRHPSRQHRQRMPQVDHLVQSGAEKVAGRHGFVSRFPSGFGTRYFNFPGITD